MRSAIGFRPSGLGRLHARKVPIAETFHVYVDGEGDLRTDHAVSLWSIPVLRLHYRMRREPPYPGSSSS